MERSQVVPFINPSQVMQLPMDPSQVVPLFMEPSQVVPLIDPSQVVQDPSQVVLLPVGRSQVLLLPMERSQVVPLPMELSQVVPLPMEPSLVVPHGPDPSPADAVERGAGFFEPFGTLGSPLRSRPGLAVPRSACSVVVRLRGESCSPPSLAAPRGASMLTWTRLLHSHDCARSRSWKEATKVPQRTVRSGGAMPRMGTRSSGKMA